jgi:hypothetical protein
MRLSRLLFVVAVLLTSGLMAASEVPEILTLTDNVSNDYELGWQRPTGCSSQQMVRDATAQSGCLVAPSLQSDFQVSLSSTSRYQQTSPPLLSMLGVQRK